MARFKNMISFAPNCSVSSAIHETDNFLILAESDLKFKTIFVCHSYQLLSKTDILLKSNDIANAAVLKGKEFDMYFEANTLFCCKL